MKGGLAASIIAVEALIDSAARLAGRARDLRHGRRGVRRLRRSALSGGARLVLAPRVDHVIIPEPLNVDRVCIGHRGVWWAEIETHGRIAHGSMPFLGDCAVRHMNAVIDRFERDLYPRLAARPHRHAGGARRARATRRSTSIRSTAARPSSRAALPAPCVPDSCRMVIDRRC
jgi:succinyl-diaminopimelate desuccinylase